MPFLSILARAAVALLALTAVAQGGDRITGAPFVTRSEVIAPSAMAATSHPLATQIALDLMRRGGNAIDAAIAANAALGLMEPTGNGIGGDLFAIVWHAETQKLYGLNASGRSPQSLTLQYFLDRGYEHVPSHGPLPVSVPGAVDGWFQLYERFGKLSMKEILAPAIDYAKNGFPVTELIAYYWNRSVPILEKYPGFSDVFMPNGRAPRKGEMFRNPALAGTYETLVRKGRDGFYNGKIARVMAKYVQEQGGFLSERDLAEHRSEWVEPESTNYRGYDVWELPPNGQGIAALQILNILEAYDLAAMGHDSPGYVHLFAEAKKLAFEDRARYYADMAFYQTPVDKLISKKYAAERRELISLDRAAKSYPAGKLDHGDTIYLTVADRDGNMVSLIQSNYRGMGSGMTPPGLGFILQDRGELFSLKAGHPNVFAPGKRPFHTIIPAFISKDGKPWVSFGLMGGGMQPQGHAQIVINLVDFGMNLQEAGDAARIRHDGSSQPTDEIMDDGGSLFLESGFSAGTVRKLAKMGHRIRSGAGGFGGYQAIMRDHEQGVYIGASESRKDGHAAGY
ncbi:MAG: gamma-glutamyltransferase [Gammaproteobacteria bacterium]|nr:gamma-glutamyltransferase [Gammaproteobacteria bacterium]